MTTFDAPSREVCTVRRVPTNTPLQSLVTLNDPVYVEAAQALARRVLAECTEDVEDRMIHAFRTCLARYPTPAELGRLLTFYRMTHQHYEQAVDDARQIATEPLGALPAGTDVVELASWTLVSNTLLNLDEVLARP
jgi:hypothetical protein